jgi:segregation and condensation protein A
MSNTATFNVKTEVFEGPLDLLLSLIEQRKLLINDISLSKVTDDYIAYINQIQSFPVAEIADFLIVASTLLLIKSKSLIPSLNLTEEETESIGDLEKRLKIYKKYKELAQKLRYLFGQKVMFFEEPREIQRIFSPDTSINKDNILIAIKGLLQSAPELEKLSKVTIKKVINLKAMIDNLINRIKSVKKLNFSDFSAEYKEDKINIIVGFLAMLELVKQGMILVSQNENFKDIEIEANNETY